MLLHKCTRFLLLLVSGTVFFCQQGNAQKRYYDLLRYNDADFSFLRTDSTDKDLFNPVKYLPFNKKGTTYLTLGGEIRENYQWIKNENWGDIPPAWKDDDGFLWHRLMMHADFRTGKTTRLFVQLKNTSVISRAGGARPVIDRDDISLHQAFADFSFRSGNNQFIIRAGRQEHNFGWGKLVSVREGPNNRQNFDGVTLFHSSAYCNNRVFFANDVSVADGVFDNGPVRNKFIFGWYSTYQLPRTPALQLETYYIRSHSPQLQFAGETGTDKRHTIGSRVASTQRGFIYELEAVYQWGRFASRAVSAGSAVGMLGYHWDKLKWQPRLQLWGGLSTGDKASSSKLNTYNPLYPRPPFTQAFAFGVSNINAAQLEFSVRPILPMRLAAGSFLLKRNSEDDGIYTPGVTPIRPLAWQPGISLLSKDLASYHYLEAEYFKGRHWQFNLQAAIVPPGTFIRQTGQGRTIGYIMTQATFRF